MRYYELTESRSEEIEIQKAIEFLRDNCSDALSAAPIYRGVKQPPKDAFFIDPKKSTRKSRNTKNFHTLLVDNSPRWQAYPNRSQSIICTTNERRALDYGRGSAYRVFPVNGSKIGICPANDWWFSFSFLEESMEKFDRLRLMKGDINEFNYLLSGLANVSLPAGSGQLDDDDYSTLVRQLDLVDKTIQDTPLKPTFEHYSEFYQLIKGGKPHIVDNLAALFDPRNNEFDLVDIKNFNTKEVDIELWTDGASILVEIVSSAYSALQDAFNMTTVNGSLINL